MSGVTERGPGQRDGRTRARVVIRSRIGLAQWASDVWKYRAVLVALCARDIRGKYKQAVLGIAWALIQPISQAAVMLLAFRGVAHVETPIAYPLFVMAGLLVFNLFSQVFGFGVPALVSAQGLITKVYFPRLYVVLSAGSSAYVNAGVTVVAVLCAALFYGTETRLRGVLAAAVLLVAAVLWALGLAALLGALNAFFRDVQYAVPLIQMLLIYLSAVPYPIQSVPMELRPLVAHNPLALMVDGFRAGLLGIPAYSWPDAWAVAAASIFVFALGVAVFEVAQARVIDIL